MTAWLIMGHPLQLPLALAIALNPPPDCKFNLLVSRHKMWKNIEIDEYRKYFGQIIFFEPIYYAHGLREAIAIISKLRRTKQQIANLPVKKHDVLVSLEVWNYIENLVTTVFKNNKQIFLCPEGIFDFVSMDLKTIYSQKGRYVTKSGLIHHFLIEKLMRLKKRTFYYWVKSLRDDHGIAYSQDINTLYDKVFILRSVFRKNIGENEMYYPYPLLKSSSQNREKQKRIVFFLTGYVKNENYYGKISAILQNLRQLYGKDHLLEIRLNPNYPEAHKQVNAGGWVINKEPGNAEQYLIRHAQVITGAFSHISTTLIFSLNLGVPSYSYYRCMDFEPDYVAWHDKIYESAPKEFFMKSFDQKPEEYQPLPDGENKARQSLNKLFLSCTA